MQELGSEISKAKLERFKITTRLNAAYAASSTSPDDSIDVQVMAAVRPLITEHISTCCEPAVRRAYEASVDALNKQQAISSVILTHLLHTHRKLNPTSL
jgi:hypothetical protein